MVFKTAKDRQGSYEIDWTRLEEGADTLPSSIEFIPFHAGDARVMSCPADEVMYCGTGKERITHALIALRVGDRAVHHAMPVSLMRQLAANLLKTADMIEAGRKN